MLQLQSFSASSVVFIGMFFSLSFVGRVRWEEIAVGVFVFECIFSFALDAAVVRILVDGSSIRSSKVFVSAVSFAFEESITFEVTAVLLEDTSTLGIFLFMTVRLFCRRKNDADRNDVDDGGGGGGMMSFTSSDWSCSGAARRDG